MRLLLIERDGTKAETVVESTRLAGYTIDWKGDRASAEQALNREKYDLLLLALDLKHPDSIELLIGYRKAGGEAPVIVLSDHLHASERIQSLYAGADDHMTRPLDGEELAARSSR